MMSKCAGNATFCDNSPSPTVFSRSKKEFRIGFHDVSTWSKLLRTLIPRCLCSAEGLEFDKLALHAL